tara:strand:+ start:26 stop:241 length:216 start_codon:yes stop_codon:yes gene_type:complete
MKWIEEHEKECKILDSDKCNECFHISESLYALSEAHEEKQAKKNQPKAKSPVKTKLAYNYRLKEWRDEVIK